MTLRDFRSVLPALLLGMALCLAGSATPSAKTVREATVRQPAAPPAAQGTGGNSVERIAAVVNDDIISVSDLQTRIQLAIVATGLPDSPEARSKLGPQVLRGLIDERLQLQEAKRANIKVTDKELDEAMGRLAEQNRMPRAQMDDFLKSRGVSLAALKEQIRATLAWNKVIGRKLRPNVEIGEDEIDSVIQRIKANAGKPEYQVSQIFLSVDQPEQDEEVRRLADRLVDQIAQGASFAAVARQFSQAAGAANGGDLGWVQQGQLDKELDDKLKELKPGQISRPVRTFTGYTILLLRDQRTVAAGDAGPVRLGLKQVVVPLGAGDPAAQRAKAEELRAGLNGCDAMDARIKETAAAGSADLGMVKPADLPQEFGKTIASLPIGQPSPVLANQEELLILMVCKREEGGGGSLPSRDQIANGLGAERLDMMQRRLLRDLRRAAYVDVRI